MSACSLSIFGIGSLAGLLLVPYSTYAKYLKWLTISLFAYVGVAFFAHVSWPAVLRATLLPHVELSTRVSYGIVAVLGTTISPYLFFWQASQEVEEVRTNHGEKPLKHAPSQAQEQLGRIRIDTYLGMALSNSVAFFIILTAAATLHAHGITEISTSAQAAKALEPVADVLRFCSLCAASWARVCWPFRCWRLRLATESARHAAGKPASSANRARQFVFTRRSRLRPLSAFR